LTFQNGSKDTYLWPFKYAKKTEILPKFDNSFGNHELLAEKTFEGNFHVFNQIVYNEIKQVYDNS
jgi:hypothetical protein